MARDRDLRIPLPRDPSASGPREFLYPYRVLTEHGSTLALEAATLAEFAEIYAWNVAESPQTGIVNAVQNQCWRENPGAMRHLIRLLAIGTLGVAPHQVGEAIAWHEGYVALHDGDPEPLTDLNDYFAFWTGDGADALGGVCEQSGLLCWWEVTLGPGWAAQKSYFLQEFTDFLFDGAPGRVEHIWIDRDVEAELRPLVHARVAR